MGIRTDLLVTEEIAESSDLRATPFEFERAKRVEAALSILEGKWKIVILNRLFARPIWRFSELERAVPGISQRMLSQQLRLLEKCELVKRTVHPQFPPKVEYEREILRERVRAGLAEAPLNGKHLGRSPTATLQSVSIRKLYRVGVSKAEIARRLRIGRTSVRRILACLR
jgi:DNA-binding HxlR family transcriptional regulator